MLATMILRQGLTVGNHNPPSQKSPNCFFERASNVTTGGTLIASDYYTNPEMKLNRAREHLCVLHHIPDPHVGLSQEDETSSLSRVLSDPNSVSALLSLGRTSSELSDGVNPNNREH